MDGFPLAFPGISAWRRGERERGAVLFGSFLSAALMAIFAWGTSLGLFMIGFAFVIHLFALVDQIRRRGFVPMGRWTPWFAIAGALGLGVYGPSLLVAAWIAWPGGNGAESRDVFLVNGWAYAHDDPRLDDLVFYQASPLGESRLGRVIASKGHDVEWTNDQLKVAGRPVTLGTPFRSSIAPRELRYQIPDGQVLLNPCPETDDEQLSNHGAVGLIVVNRDQILGKAWAKFYPVNERRLLQ